MCVDGSKSNLNGVTIAECDGIFLKWLICAAQGYTETLNLDTAETLNDNCD